MQNKKSDIVNTNIQKHNRYDAINGLRAVAAILIVMMHVKYNSGIVIENNYFYNNIVPSFAHLVFLFMIISGFGMCCGYYQKFKDKEIDLNEFYKKRFLRIIPFFTILVVIDLVNERSLASVLEGFMDLTLLYGLLPNNDLSVIGVGWTLGVIFVFYLMFPFFVVLLQNKKRAWGVLAISILINFICNEYLFKAPFVLEGHFSPRKNFLYCICFFILGGLIFLYKEDIIKIKENKMLRHIFYCILLILTIGYFFVPDGMVIENNYLFILKILVLYGGWLIFAIITKGKILSNKLTRFISDLSMEIYLSHMFIFRIIEKTTLLKKVKEFIPNTQIQFAIVFALTVGGVIIFTYIAKKIINRFFKSIKV